MIFDSIMPDFDLGTVLGKQAFRKWIIGLIRNEIQSYTPEALGMSTTMSILENTVNELDVRRTTLVTTHTELPTVGNLGQLVFETSAHKLWIWNGSSWEVV